MRGNWVLPMLILGSLGLSGCGVSSAHPTGVTKTMQPRVVVTPSVTSKTASGVIHPTRVLAGPEDTTREVIHADLTGHGTDTLTVTRQASGAGELTVEGPSAKVLWTKPRVGQVAVLDYGPKHLPIVVATADQSFCGTGGCSFNGYSYDAKTKSFHEVPGAPSQESGPNYVYSASQRHFVVSTVPQDQPLPEFFGFGGASRVGISVTDRLYDTFQHRVTFSYALDVTPQGSHWTEVGKPYFSPKTIDFGSVPYPQDAKSVAEGFVSAEAMNLRLTAEEFTATPGDVVDWQATLGASLRHDATTPVFDDSLWSVSSVASGKPGILMPYYVLPDPYRLVSYRLSLGMSLVNGAWKVSNVSVEPVSLRFATKSSVLNALTHHPRFLHTLLQEPNRAVMLVPASADTWSISFDGQVTPNEWTFNAVSGKLAPVSP